MAVTVAALFVQEGGAYYGVDGVDPWPESRDARAYDGPHPVVAHPPCQLWVNMAGHNFIRYTREKGRPQPHLRPGNDGGCFAKALGAVRRWGGVLEHPAGSHAWRTFALPPPSKTGWTLTSMHVRAGPGFLNMREWVCEVWQSAYGHQARKRTWLLWCGAGAPRDLYWSRPEGQKQVGWFDRNRPTLSKREAIATPPAFRDALLALARSARETGHASS